MALCSNCPPAVSLIVSAGFPSVLDASYWALNQNNRIQCGEGYFIPMEVTSGASRNLVRNFSSKQLCRFAALFPFI